MFQRRTIITLIILFIIYLGVVYAARQRKVTPKSLQPAATVSQEAPVTNQGQLLTAQPGTAQTNIHNQLD
jgi:hypothetical protein